MKICPIWSNIVLLLGMFKTIRYKLIIPQKLTLIVYEWMDKSMNQIFQVIFFKDLNARMA